MLDEVIQEMTNGANRAMPLDFFVLFSSVSSLLAPAGQVDYVAANAFLDAFAVSRRDDPRHRDQLGTVAGCWHGGSTVVVASAAGAALLDTADEIVYSVTLSYERNWVLAEHRLKSGRAVLPGTGYLEMAVRRLDEGHRSITAWNSRTCFLLRHSSPIPARREKRTWLCAGMATELSSSRSAHAMSEWVEYASGHIAMWQGSPPADRGIDRILARCQSRTLAFDDTHRTEQEKFFNFGPRWHCLKAIHFGEKEALADLELAAPFSEDMSGYHLHPALFDLATGSALYLIDDYGEFEFCLFPDIL